MIANLPPVGEFPAFPRLMQRFLGRWVRLHGDAIADSPSRFPNVHYVSHRIRLDEWVERMNGTIRFSDLFVDGVHPSSLTYRLWAEEIVEHARQRGALDGSAA